MILMHEPHMLRPSSTSENLRQSDRLALAKTIPNQLRKNMEEASHNHLMAFGIHNINRGLTPQPPECLMGECGAFSRCLRKTVRKRHTSYKINIFFMRYEVLLPAPSGPSGSYHT